MNLSTNRETRPAAPKIGPSTPTPAPTRNKVLDLGADALRDEVKRISAINQKLMKQLEASKVIPTEDSWEERLAEYEKLLEEKSETIRMLHMEMQELKASGGGRNVSGGEREEFQRMQEEIEEHRRQMQDDEQALLDQAKQMEMAMAKDRAELARQRNELQRMQSDLNREIEMASRDPLLRERLMNLQRRPADSGGSRRPNTMQAVPRPGSDPNAHQPGGQNANPQPPATQKTGMFKRFFG